MVSNMVITHICSAITVAYTKRNAKSVHRGALRKTITDSLETTGTVIDRSAQDMAARAKAPTELHWRPLGPRSSELSE